MKKKDLKVVDLDDLQPESLDFNQEDEVTVEAKVNIDDLKKIKSSIGLISKNPTNQVKIEKKLQKIDSSIIKSPRFKNYRGNRSQESVVSFMSEKFRFDRKRYNRLRSAVVIFMLVFGFLHRFWEDPFEKMNILSSLRGIFFYPISKAYDLYGRYYLVITAIFIYFFPLNQNTDTQVVISYDNIIVPSQVFALSRPLKTRIKWDAISDIEFQKKYGVPFVQLMNAKKELIGEIRLDFDDMDRFYEVLDTYCPSENPLRILFTNTLNS